MSSTPMRPVAPMIPTRVFTPALAGAPFVASASRAVRSAFGSGEEALHAFEESVFARRVPRAFFLQRAVEFSQQFFLLAGEIDRSLHRHAAEQVTACATAHRLDALVAQTKDTAGLRLRRDLQRHLSIERGHDDRAAQRGRDETHRHFTGQMLAVALEDLVRLHVHLDIEVTGRTTVAAGLTFTRQADAITAVHAGRNLHRELARAAHAPLPEAGIAGILHHLATAAATRTGLLEVQHAAHGHAHLAGAIAGVAGGRIGALGRAGTMAGLALGKPGHLDLDTGAEHGLRQGQRELVAQVGAAEYLRAAAAAAAPSAEDVTEYIAEDVAEIATGIEARSAAAALGLEALVSELVVRGASGRVGQDLVGLLDLLE